MKSRSNDIMKWKVGNTHLFLFLICLLLPVQKNYAQKSIDEYPNIYSAYQNVLKLKLELGRDQLTAITPSQDQTGHYHYVRSLVDALEILISEDVTLYKRYSKREEESLGGIDSMDDQDPYKKFYSSEIKIHWALVHTLFQDELKAGWALRNAYQEIQSNLEAHPYFIHNFKTLGTLHVLFSTVPESYQWVLKLMGLQSSVIDGWNELNKIKFRNPYWLETSLIKSTIAINILNQESITMDILNDLLPKNKSNLIVNYLYNIALIKYSRSEEALPSLVRLTYLGGTYTHISYVYYKLGEAYLQKQEYNLARLNYSKFLSKHQGENYIKDAWFKIFLTYWLNNEPKMAEVHWNNAKKSGRMLIAEDKNASEYLKKDTYPNTELYQARLAIDGGYFDVARSILKKLNPDSLETKEDVTEYYYRQGRLFDKLDQKEDAIFHYLTAIKKAGKENWYFAPSACLQAGYIYRDRGDNEKAIYYFEKVLAYNKHKYKEGLDSKAQAALSLIQETKKVNQ